MTLASDAIDYVNNQTRSASDKQTLLRRLRGVHGSEAANAAINAARRRRTAVIYGLRQAVSQADVLVEQINKVVTTATALKATLADIKDNATGLGTPTAGDSASTAITTLLTTFGTALTGVTPVSSLTYASYRDE